ncbi:uncharacterized protein LOC125847223 [Solanum stenotomum]|uniref:uncharacterized protein LOC125847223 n=1 Tax=Solanum stenotomum TaxID=172797 RepID=UPI0020D07C4F|nr:uncharacterized protein LOC125847223 [Solanum stenotomum]
MVESCVGRPLFLVLGSACVAATRAKLSIRFRSKVSSVFSLRAMAKTTPSQSPSPPTPKKLRHDMELFGDVRVDNYYWLRDDSRSNPELLSYLHEENAYTDSVMSGTKQLEDHIYTEIRGRIKEDGISAPMRRGSYFYYRRNLEGKEYVQHCRCYVPTSGAPTSVYDTMPTGPDAPSEHIILDENVKALEHAYYSIGAFKVSPNNKLVAYAEDTKGDEIYTVYVIDAESGMLVGKPLVGAITSYLEWAGDDALVYITMDEILRPDKVWLHELGTNQLDNSCLYHENDETFSLDLQASESKKYLFIASESKITRFVFYLDTSKPENGLVVLTSRVTGIDTSASHRGNHFFIKRRSDECFNSELLACPVENISATTVLLPHRPSIKLQDIQLFTDHLAVHERENGLPRITVYHLPAVGEPLERLQGGHAVEFVDPVYSVDPLESEFESGVLRFSYSSMRTPPSVYDYDMDTGVSVLKKIETILGGTHLPFKLQTTSRNERVGPYVPPGNKESCNREAGDSMSRVEEVMQKMLEKFDTTDQNLKETRTELSVIGQKINAHEVSIELLERQFSQLSAIVNTRQLGMLPNNTIQNLKNDGHCIAFTTHEGKQIIDPPMPSDVERVVEIDGDEIEVTEETKNAIEKEAEIAQKVIPMPRPPPPFPQRLVQKAEEGKYRRFITILKQFSIDVLLI